MTIKVTYNVTDVYVTQDVSPVYINVSYSGGGSGGAAVWGGITGTLSNQTDLQSALDLKVPYTGATTNVNLGEYEIKAGQVTLDTSPTGTATVGTTRWNDTTGLTETTLKGGNVVLKNGVDLVARVVNKVSPNTTLTKAAYQAVRVSGAQGQRLAVAFAQANNDNNSADTIGLVTETIATNQEGFIITVGQLENINTTGSLQGETWADGDVLYLSPTTPGALTNVKPNATVGHIVVIGYVEYAHANNGKIYVKVMNGWELGELHDVYVPTPSNNDILTYETSSGLWKNKSVGTALGYTPANAATTLTINGVSYDLSANRSWTVAGGISGSGASGQVAYWTGTSAQSGSNNLFWDNSNIRLGIGANTPATIIDAKGDRATVTITDTNSGGANPTFFGAFADFLQLSVNRNPSTGIFAQTGKATSQISLEGAANTSSIRFFATNTNNTLPEERLRLYGTGNLLIQSGGTYSDGGQRLQVQGTTLLNGNVTFSSSTGMFWDASNSRLGIGTNAPTFKLSISGGGLSVSDGTYTGNITFGSAIGSSNGAFDFVYPANGALRFGTAAVNGAMFQGFGGNHPTLAGNMYFDYGSGTQSLPNRSVFFRNTTPAYNYTNVLVLSANSNVLINSTTDSGERLQVTGTMKVTGDMSAGGRFHIENGLYFNYGGGSFNRRVMSNDNSAITFRLPTNGNTYYFTNWNSSSTAQSLVQINDSTIKLDVFGQARVQSKLSITAGTTSDAQINLASSTAPTSPNNGDIWFDGTDIKMRIGGVTKTFTLV